MALVTDRMELARDFLAAARPVTLAGEPSADDAELGITVFA